jgi:hypothetical protein
VSTAANHRYEAHSRRVLAAFLQHVIPAGFPRIRYFGFLANLASGPEKRIS